MAADSPHLVGRNFLFQSTQDTSNFCANSSTWCRVRVSTPCASARLGSVHFQWNPISNIIKIIIVLQDLLRRPTTTPGPSRIPFPAPLSRRPCPGALVIDAWRLSGGRFSKETGMPRPFVRDRMGAFVGHARTTDSKGSTGPPRSASIAG
jgi:hypothetical protein